MRAARCRMVHRVLDAKTPPTAPAAGDRRLMDLPDIGSELDTSDPVANIGDEAGRSNTTWLEVSLIVPLAAWLAWQAWGVDWTTVGWGALFFVVCIAAVDLIPIPAWEDVELSLS